MTARFPLFAAALTVVSAQAHAGPVTPEGTARLTEAFQTYLGKTPGLVSVQPGNGVYDVRLDAAPLAALIPAEGGALVVKPWLFTLEDRGDGTWAYAQSQKDWDLVFSVPGTMDTVLRVGEMAGSGVFDPALMAFTSYSGTMQDLVTTQVVTVPDQPEQRTTYTIASGSYESSARPSATQGVDGEMTYTTVDVDQTMTMPDFTDPSKTTELTVTTARSVSTSTTTGVDTVAIYGMIAWFVAHPSTEAILRDQADLKRLMLDALPVFDTLRATSTTEGIRVTTPLGVFAATSADIGVDLNGITTDGLFGEGIKVTGLTLPDGVLPDWARGLVPSDASVKFAVSGFDLATPAATAIPALDFSKPEPLDKATIDSLLPQLLPTGRVTLSVGPDATTAPLYTLTYEGSMQAGPSGVPTGRATITMTGMDAVIDALNASPLTAQDGVGPGLAMARGMAKPGEGGAIVWEIDATVPGTLKVNGTDMAPMMGGMQ